MLIVSPSATYTRQLIRSILAQIDARCLFGAKPLSKPMVGYFQMYPSEQMYQNTKLFIHENASKTIVCEMAAIFSKGYELKEPGSCMAFTFLIKQNFVYSILTIEILFNQAVFIRCES